MAKHATLIQSVATKHTNKIFGGLIWSLCVVITAYSIGETSSEQTLTYWILLDVQSNFYVHSGFISTVAQDWSVREKRQIQKLTIKREHTKMLLAIRTSNQSIPYLLSIFSPSLQHNIDWFHILSLNRTLCRLKEWKNFTCFIHVDTKSVTVI